MDKKKILIIDDSPFMTQMFALRLHEEGFETLIAGGGEDGLAIAANEKPDLILSDISMPKVTGWDVLKGLKGNKKTADIPVIILTNSKGNKEERDRAASLGASEYLMKIELKVDDIMKVVKKYL